MTLECARISSSSIDIGDSGISCVVFFNLIAFLSLSPLGTRYLCYCLTYWKSHACIFEENQDIFDIVPFAFALFVF